MFTIVKKTELSDLVILFEIEAPQIAKKAKAGNFFVVKIHEQGERIPLTIADFDRERGTITAVFQKMGKTTSHLGTLKEGDSLTDVIRSARHAFPY